jgi:hypothetical protein
MRPRRVPLCANDPMAMTSFLRIDFSSASLPSVPLFKSVGNADSWKRSILTSPYGETCIFAKRRVRCQIAVTNPFLLTSRHEVSEDVTRRAPARVPELGFWVELGRFDGVSVAVHIGLRPRSRPRLTVPHVPDTVRPLVARVDVAARQDETFLSCTGDRFIDRPRSVAARVLVHVRAIPRMETHSGAHRA